MTDPAHDAPEMPDPPDLDDHSAEPRQHQPGAGSDGHRVEWGRVPFLSRMHRPSDGSRLWKVVLDRVLARPGLSAALSAGFLLVIASPAIGLHTETLSVEKILPSSTPIVQSYDHIMAAFPGGPTPALVVVKAPDIQSAAARPAIAALTGWHSTAIGQPIHVSIYPAANLAEIQIPLAGTGADTTSQHALATLHDTIVQATVGKIPGGQALVGGALAASIDFNNQLRHGIVPASCSSFRSRSS